MEMKKNMNMIRGTKPITPPTPSIAPLTIRDLINPSGSKFHAILWSQLKNPSINAIGALLMKNVNWKRPNSTAAMTTGPRKGFVRNLSILSDRYTLFSDEWLFIRLTTPATNPYL